MDPTNVGGRAFAATPVMDTEAIDFVRFCHRRRRVGWPELYDEMCAVAGRGLYRGYGADELAAIGIGLGLFQMPALAGLVAQVVAEDVERRRRSAEALRASLTEQDAGPVPLATSDGGATGAGAAVGAVAGTGSPARSSESQGLDPGPGLGVVRIAVAAGA